MLGQEWDKDKELKMWLIKWSMNNSLQVIINNKRNKIRIWVTINKSKINIFLSKEICQVILKIYNKTVKTIVR